MEPDKVSMMSFEVLKSAVFSSESCMVKDKVKQKPNTIFVYEGSQQRLQSYLFNSGYLEKFANTVSFKTIVWKRRKSLSNFLSALWVSDTDGQCFF